MLSEKMCANDPLTSWEFQGPPCRVKPQHLDMKKKKCFTAKRGAWQLLLCFPECMIEICRRNRSQLQTQDALYVITSVGECYFYKLTRCNASIFKRLIPIQLSTEQRETCISSHRFFLLTILQKDGWRLYSCWNVSSKWLKSWQGICCSVPRQGEDQDVDRFLTDIQLNSNLAEQPHIPTNTAGKPRAAQGPAHSLSSAPPITSTQRTDTTCIPVIDRQLRDEGLNISTGCYNMIYWRRESYHRRRVSEVSIPGRIILPLSLIFISWNDIWRRTSWRCCHAEAYD